MATSIDFTDSLLQRQWHAQWPRWVNALLAYEYVLTCGDPRSSEGIEAMRETRRWLRGQTSDEAVTRAMKAAFEVSPILGNSDQYALRAACVAACAVNPNDETVMIYPTMCITDHKVCAKRAETVLGWLGPLTGPDDQYVAMDRLEELGVLPVEV